MENLAKSSLVTGFWLFLICALLVLLNAGYVLMWITLSPGLIFAICVVTYIPENINWFRQLALVILSGSIYITCYYFLQIVDEKGVCSRLILLSGIGAFALKLCYDILILKSVSITRTLALPLALGIGTAIPSAICMNYFLVTKNVLLYAGVFLIYPLWYCGMGALIARSLKQLAPLQTISEQ
ncbi:MAG: hypothetical protein JST19_09430 [Bacteroidetes bacterium]|nr:hypothetical protein [Bacteroidota bacterium]